MQRTGIRRALVLVLVLLAGWGFAPPSAADQCTYCSHELEHGANPLKCPNCVQLAERIARTNERVWVLDFQQGEIGRIQLKDDTGDVENFWFLPYTLTNRDDVAHRFLIDVTATSDKGRRQHQYRDLWVPDAYEEIRRLLGKREGEQLLSKRELGGSPAGERSVPPRVSDRRTKETAKIALPMIQPGETLACVAIMGPFDPEMDRLVVSIRGLTNSSLLTHDDYVAPDGSPHRRVVKEAVLQLHYRRPGDEFAHGLDPLRFEGRRWTDVARTIKSDLR